MHDRMPVFALAASSVIGIAVAIRESARPPRHVPEGSPHPAGGRIGSGGQFDMRKPMAILSGANSNRLQRLAAIFREVGIVQKKEKNEVSVKSVKKALDALDFILSESLGRDGVALGEVAARLGIRNTTAHNILKTMETCGYIARTGKLYSLGPKCSQFARNPSLRTGLLDAASPILLDLAKRTGESFVLTTLINGERQVLLRVKGGGVVSVEPEKADGASVAWNLVTTHAMLAFAPGNELEFFIRKHSPRLSSSGKKIFAELLRNLGKIRRDGFAEGRNPELASLAVPILDPKSFLLGAVGAYAPSFRFDKEKRRKLLLELSRAARKISGTLKT